MKYIRTKDGVYSEIKYKVAKAFVSTFEEEQAKMMPTQKTDFTIINQANTIEELCDVLVNIAYDGHGKPHWEIRCLYDRTWKKDFKNDSDWSIYGAIWTDKGLIYVAKMNSEGELELL